MNTEEITHPKHYHGEIEPIELIESLIELIESLGHLESFCVGNIIKLVSRYRKKEGIKDLLKAQYYLNRLINILSRENEFKDSETKQDTV